MRKKRVLKSMLIFFLLSLLLLAGCQKKSKSLLSSEQSKRTSSQVKYVEVPSFDSFTLSQAKELASQRKLSIRVAVGGEKGMVVRQLPPPGTKVKEGSSVWVWLEEVKLASGTSSKSTSQSESTSSPTTSSSENDYVVCIDPGHQKTPDLSLEPIAPGSSKKKEKCRGGTKGVNTGIPEYQINLEIALKLRERLEEEGVKVVMTRETNEVNISNRERAEIANQAQADLFVRLHFNGNKSPDRRGFLILVPSKSAVSSSIYSESKKAAVYIKNSYREATNLRYEGIFERSDITGFNWSKVPVVLVELAYLTSPKDESLVTSVDFQKRMVEGLAEGILEFLRESD